MTFFSQLSGGEFTPLFRLLDDYDSHCIQKSNKSVSASSFNPRFDVRETKDAYLLDGEIPSVKQDNINIEFSDAQTLVIRGHSKRDYTTSNIEQPVEPAKPAEPAEKTPESDDDETSSTGYSRVTVEDVDDDYPGYTPPEKTATPPPKPVTKAASHTTIKKGSQPAFRYWVSERSFGQFNRVFKFPTPVDQDAVRASLNNGILSVVIPKAAPPTFKKISIE
ncbi:hypothetical protein FQN57_007112 [Myotisia sp. PD_48]|nr:hypothetical protein FQN57_007112 [Myotisia sp. PD_48]